MPLNKSVNSASTLRDMFNSYGRYDQFSYAAYDVLFDYYDQFEESIECDVIAICCDWCEYDGLVDLVSYYDVSDIIGHLGPHPYDVKRDLSKHFDLEAVESYYLKYMLDYCDRLDDLEDEILECVQDSCCLLHVDGGSFLCSG